MNNKDLVSIFFEIIKPAVGEKLNLQAKEAIENIDIRQLFYLVRNSDAATMTFDGLEALIKDKRVDEQVVEEWRASAISLGCYQVQHIYNVKNIYEQLEMESLKPILFKGVIIGDLYKEDYFRISKDTDILVSAADFNKAKDVLEANNYVYNEEKSKANVAVYKNEILKHKVELHKSLYEDYHGEKIDILKSLKLEEALSFVDTSLGRFRTLNETNHLIFQIFHIVKHFTVQGISIKYLTDLKVFIENNYDKIDWDKLSVAMEKLEYMDFVHFILYVLVEKLSLKKIPYPIKENYSQEDVFMVLQDIIHKGDIENKNHFDYQMITVLEPYMVGNAKSHKSSRGRKLQAIFPASDQLSDYYMYAKKHKIFLPVAWVHRIIVYFKSRCLNKKNNKNLMNHREKFDTMEYRIKLLKIVGLAK